MIDPKILDYSIEKIRQIGKNKIKNYEIFPKLKLLRTNYKKQLILLEVLRTKKNILSKEIGELINQQKPTYEIEDTKKQVNDLKIEIRSIAINTEELNKELYNNLARIENIPDSSCIVGEEEIGDKEVRTYLKPRAKKYSHITLANNLNLVDWKRTSNLSGSRFVTYIGKGALLKRALMNFMLDHNSQKGYTEIANPFLVNEKAVFGTGQLPKFKNDLYKIEDKNLYLIPTSEVSLTNFYQDTIFDEAKLPIKMTQFSPCFRQEAGAAGKDNNGIIRLHQFDKVELVKLVTPETSSAELEKMVIDAESILKKLELPYRVMNLCTGSIGFSAAQTYDIEVWMPSQNKYREISSCSNCTDFQARRINLKYKKDDKNLYIHTLNGSALAIDRLIATFLENHQTKLNSISIPEVLRPYMQGLTEIT